MGKSGKELEKEENIEERDKFSVPFKLEEIIHMLLLVLHNQIKNIAKILFLQKLLLRIRYIYNTEYNIYQRRKIVIRS